MPDSLQARTIAQALASPRKHGQLSLTGRQSPPPPSGFGSGLFPGLPLSAPRRSPAAPTSLPGPRPLMVPGLSLVIPGVQRSLHRPRKWTSHGSAMGHNGTTRPNHRCILGCCSRTIEALTLTTPSASTQAPALADRHPEPLHWVRFACRPRDGISMRPTPQKTTDRLCTVGALPPWDYLGWTPSVAFIRSHTHGKGHCVRNT